jgi:hypothetical protein
VVGGYFDALMMEHQTALDQEAATNAAVAGDTAHFQPVPAFRTPSLGLHSFPSGGSGGSGGGFGVYTDQLNSVASTMGSQDVTTLESGQSALNNDGPFGLISTAGWETADNLASNFGTAYNAVSTYMQQLLSVYHETVTALRKTAANYGDADSDSAAAANQVGGEAS